MIDRIVGFPTPERSFCDPKWVLLRCRFIGCISAVSTGHSPATGTAQRRDRFRLFPRFHRDRCGRSPESSLSESETRSEVGSFGFAQKCTVVTARPAILSCWHPVSNVPSPPRPRAAGGCRPSALRCGHGLRTPPCSSRPVRSCSVALASSSPPCSSVYAGLHIAADMQEVC